MNATAARSTEMFANRRLRRVAMTGPRCPDCAGPLIYGEGCHLCPVCGFSGCSTSRR